MSTRHDGVSCDNCLKTNFRGLRFKCLVCFDYDLCSTCQEDVATTGRHTTAHPVQCIITPSQYELYYGNELVDRSKPQSLTCPYCSNAGFTVSGLEEHLGKEHFGPNQEVMCPVCAATSHDDPNRASEDLATHLRAEHGNREDTVRVRSQRSHRPATLSDPIAELLSQLSDPRRGPNLQRLQSRLSRLHPVVASTSATASSSVCASAQSLVPDLEIVPPSAPQICLLPSVLGSVPEEELRKVEVIDADRSLFARELLCSTLLHPNPYTKGTLFDTRRILKSIAETHIQNPP